MITWCHYLNSISELSAMPVLIYFIYFYHHLLNCFCGWAWKCILHSTDIFLSLEIQIYFKMALKPIILLIPKSIYFFFCLLPDTWFSTNLVFVQSHFFTLPVTFHSPHPDSVFTTRQHIFSFNGFLVNFHFTLWHRIKFLTSHAKVCTPTLNNK